MALALFAVAMVPRAVPVVLIIAGVAGLAALIGSARIHLAPLMREPAVLALALFGAYLAASAFWALDPQAALEKAAVILLLSAATVGLAARLAALERTETRRLALAAFIALFAGLGLLLIELLFGMPVWKFTYNTFPALFGDVSKDVMERTGRVVQVETNVLNHNATLAVVLLWPALMLAPMTGAFPRLAARAGLAALVALCAFLSQSQTAMAALLVGLGVFAVARAFPRAAGRALVSVWIVGVVFALPLGAMPHKLGWTSWTWLPPSSAAARFYIWSYTADKALENPLTGIGVRGTRELQKREGTKAPDADRYQPRPGRHAHNAFLQVWLETGAVGAFLLLGFGLALLRRIARLPPAAGAMGQALFATACAVGAFGYGIWQTWLLGGFALAAALFALAASLARDWQTEGGA